MTGERFKWLLNPDNYLKIAPSAEFIRRIQAPKTNNIFGFPNPETTSYITAMQAPARFK